MGNWIAIYKHICILIYMEFVTTFLSDKISRAVVQGIYRYTYIIPSLPLDIRQNAHTTYPITLKNHKRHAEC